MSELTIHDVRANVKALTDEELELLAAALKPMKDDHAEQLLKEIETCQRYRAT